MNKIESPIFMAFAHKHFGPKEQVVYTLQARDVWAERRPGKVEKVLRTQDGEACVTYYYYSEREDTLYVLAAYLVRKGEPRPAEVETVEKYIQEIEAGLL